MVRKLDLKMDRGGSPFLNKREHSQWLDLNSLNEHFNCFGKKAYRESLSDRQCSRVFYSPYVLFLISLFGFTLFELVLKHKIDFLATLGF
jgi:hypothetical protein